MDSNDRAAIEVMAKGAAESDEWQWHLLQDHEQERYLRRATAALAALRAAGWWVMHPLSSLELTDNLDLIEGLIIDVENKWGDPHTLRHAKQALADVRAVLLPPPPPEPRDE